MVYWSLPVSDATGAKFLTLYCVLALSVWSYLAVGSGTRGRCVWRITRNVVQSVRFKPTDTATSGSSEWVRSNVCIVVCSSVVKRAGKTACRYPSSFTVTYPLTATVVGAPQMTSQAVLCTLLCTPPPSWAWRSSKRVHSLMLSSHLFLCLPLSSPLFQVRFKSGEACE